MTNLLLEQYARYKKTALERSPYSCLLNADTSIKERMNVGFLL